MKVKYGINQAIESTAEALRGTNDHSPTTIRCAINDTLEMAERDGMKVNHGYDQPRAVARVKAILK